MRWQGQELGAADASALPGLESINGLVRSVTTPEFAGVTFHEVMAKSALNHVPGGSRMPFDWTVNPYRGCSHACVYCLAPDTQILMADGSSKPLQAVAVGDEIVGTVVQGAYRRYTPSSVRAKWATRKRAYRVTLADGTELVASADHRFLSDRGWKHVKGDEQGAERRPHLAVNNRLQGFGLAGPPSSDTLRTTADYRLGYLSGMIRGDGMICHGTYAGSQRVRYIHRFRLALADHEALDRTRGYLAQEGVLTHTRPFAATSSTRRTMAHHISWVREPQRPNGVTDVRVTGGQPSRQRFFRLCEPAIRRKLDITGVAVQTVADLRVVSIEDLGTEIDMIDITTDTGDFIANGVISHNCFARGTHEYLDLDGGRDFDTQVIVKVNVAEVLARELHRGSWTRQPVMLGTNTDPYQRAEGRYKLMPDIITALTDSGTPFSILTKGTLLRRDLPQLADAAREVHVTLAMSIAVFDERLQKAIEPGTPTTQARLDTVRAATDAGFRVTVFLMPILPHLSDSIAALDEALGRIKAAGAARVVFGALHLRPGVKPWFMRWLHREHPELVSSYLGLYPGAAVEAPKAYRSWLTKRVRPLLRVHGLDGRTEEETPRGVPVSGLAARSRVVTTSRGAAAAMNEPATLF